jgi:hypothetical protein
LVTPEIVETWDECLIQENDQFECWLKSQPSISYLSIHMFFVWDGDHRLAACYAYIHNMHRYDRKWYFQVDCMLLVSESHMHAIGGYERHQLVSFKIWSTLFFTVHQFFIFYYIFIGFIGLLNILILRATWLSNYIG